MIGLNPVRLLKMNMIHTVDCIKAKQTRYFVCNLQRVFVMKNVTQKAGISTTKQVVAAAVVALGTIALPAQAALTFDTSEVVTAAATVLGAVTAVGVAFMMVPVAIKGFSAIKAIIFRS